MDRRTWFPLVAFAVALALSQPASAGAGSVARTCRGLRPTLVGTPGGDTISGTPGRDVIVGRGGSDTISGLGGDDTICSGAGSDLVRGGSGGDVLVSNFGTDEVHGGRGDDALFSGRTDIEGYGDLLFGGAGDDRLLGSGHPDSRASFGSDRFYPGSGDDAVFGGDYDQVRYDFARSGVTVDLRTGIATGAGRDVLTGITSVFGTRHDDRLLGDRHVNVIDAGPGADVVRGHGGADFLFDGWGASFARDPDIPDREDDRLYGGRGNDDVVATGGRNLLIGRAGNDMLGTGRGRDRVFGSEGLDTAAFFGASAYVDLAAGIARAKGVARLRSIENISGTRYDDVLKGDGGANEIVAGTGHDVIEGRGGDDLIRPDDHWFDAAPHPRPGNDTIHGGSGVDVLSFRGTLFDRTHVDLAGGRATGQGNDAFGGIEKVIGAALDHPTDRTQH